MTLARKLQDPDPEVIRRAAAGDGDALYALLRALQPALFQLAVRMLRHRADAEDATQEVLLRIVTHLAQYRGPVGILPGLDRGEANAWVDVAVPTGLGEARNALVVRAADVLIAVGGEFGTLSEIALALKTDKPVVGIDTWELSRRGQRVKDVVRAATPADAVERAFALARDGA